jgi:hypothetical protein
MTCGMRDSLTAVALNWRIRSQTVDSLTGRVGRDHLLKFSRHVEDAAGSLISDFRNRGRVGRRRIGQCAFLERVGVFVSSVSSNQGRMRASDPNLWYPPKVTSLIMVSK